MHNNSMEIYRKVEDNGLKPKQLQRRIKNKNALVNQALGMYK